ncbi:MAG: hypothetical protein ABSG22_03500 [Sedimentisphaerales bacterium]|jgi:hypothetical protein
MSFSLLLAKTSHHLDNATVEYGTKYVLRALDFVWQQTSILTWLQAVIGISFGVIVLMYGWRIYKALTVIGFGILGLYLGLWIGNQFQKPLPGAIVGCVLLVILAIPLMRWAVAVLGAVAGGILAAGIWHSCNLPQEYVWAGGLIGFVAGGMISFVVFKLAVMLFTSLSGTSLIVIGAFALIYRYETFASDPPTTHLNHLYYSNPWFLPLLLTAGTLLGIILQFGFFKGSTKE